MSTKHKTVPNFRASGFYYILAGHKPENRYKGKTDLQHINYGSNLKLNQIKTKQLVDSLIGGAVRLEARVYRLLVQDTYKTLQQQGPRGCG